MFSNLAKEWWNVSGKMKLLHTINPIRAEYIRDLITAKFGENKDISILDFGCGGGILSEAIADIGFKQVVGFDENVDLISIAKNHAADRFQNLSYIDSKAEISQKFDVIVCMEVLEHVDDVDELLLFLKSVFKDGGLMIFSTINRTLKAKLLVKFAAEYILRIVPKGIHEYNKFIKPSELYKKMEQLGFKNNAISGLNYNPITQQFSLCRSVDMNYFMGFEMISGE